MLDLGLFLSPEKLLRNCILKKRKKTSPAPTKNKKEKKENDFKHIEEKKSDYSLVQNYKQMRSSPLT
jgi:hypothetical protein